MGIEVNKGSQSTITDVGGKKSLDVNVTDITISANNDSIETRSMAMATRLDEVSTTVNYIGSAPVGTSTASAGWLIKRLTVSGTQTIIQFASASYNQVWDNRASLTYN
jgi:hypothetical protein